jgi:hypothetical protein
MVGVSYALSRATGNGCYEISYCSPLNWFGDSLTSLYRTISQPRFAAILGIGIMFICDAIWDGVPLYREERLP